MTKLFSALYLTLCLFAATVAGPVQAQGQAGISAAATATDEINQPALTTRLVASHAEVTAGQTIQLAWEFTLQPRWHIYWSNPGDSGLPPQLKPQTGKSEALPLTFPTPKVIPLPPLTNYGYEDNVTFTTNYTVPQGLAQGLNVLPFTASFLYCRDICMPGRADLTLPLVVAARAQANPAFKPGINLPQPLPERSPLMAEAAGPTIQLTLPLNLSGPNVRFIPADEGIIDDSAPQNLTGNTLSIQLDPQATGTPANLTGLLLVNGQSYSLTTPLHQTGGTRMPLDPSLAAPQANAGAEAPLGFLGALVFAFLAGMLLNLMPCVLPVLSLKLLSLLKNHHAQGGVSGRTRHTLAYTGGVLVSLWLFAIVLAVLKSAGTHIGWGFHLQNPLMNALLVFLMVAVALNFFGIFEVGQRFTRLAAAPVITQGRGKKASAHTKAAGPDLLASFATGVLAVVVATPCTIPFMGGAMAYALTQGLLQSLMVFSMLGLGLALPFLISIPYPQVFNWLPRPGSWMTTFRHLLGWPMLATALWLAYVFTSQVGQAGLFLLLAGVLVFGFTLWLYGARPSRFTGGIAAVTAIVMLALIATYANRPQNVLWQPWSSVAVEKALQNGTPVFVDFTADWCVTCKITEATVLNSTSVQTLFAETGTILFRGDWTSQNPEIGAELARFNRRGVPLYLLYMPGKPVEVLPQLLTPGLLRAKLIPAKIP